MKMGSYLTICLHQSASINICNWLGINAPNFWGAWGGYREILSSMRRLCVKVVRGQLQELLSELTKWVKWNTRSGDHVQVIFWTMVVIFPFMEVIMCTWVTASYATFLRHASNRCATIVWGLVAGYRFEVSAELLHQKVKAKSEMCRKMKHFVPT